MNYKKAQKDIFSKLVKGDKIVQVDATDPWIILSDGYAGWVFTEEQNFIDLAKVDGPARGVELFNVASEENLLEKTDTLMEYKGCTLRQFKDDLGCSVYVQEKYLRNFDNEPRFYQANKYGLVVITEPDLTEMPQIVGFVLPVKYNENE